MAIPSNTRYFPCFELLSTGYMYVVKLASSNTADKLPMAVYCLTEQFHDESSSKLLVIRQVKYQTMGVFQQMKLEYTRAVKIKSDFKNFSIDRNTRKVHCSLFQ